MKFQLATFALIFVSALSAGIYDLDNTEVLRELESEGLYLEGEGSTENLSIASTSGSSGFSWLVERRGCRGILDVTNGVVFAQPIEGDDKSDLLI